MNRQALNKLLPLGAHTQIQKLLKEQHGKEVSLRTIGRAFNPQYPLTPNVALIIKTAIQYRDDMLRRQRAEISEELQNELANAERELAKTGS